MRRSPIPLAALLLGGALLLGCASPLARGEALYREGDWLGALEVWRSIPADHAEHRAAHRRVRELESEFEQLVVRYKQRARYFERAGRLAESMLNYRLAIQLRPEDQETLEHVQELARTLALREAELQKAVAATQAKRDLGAARAALAELRRLDPFDAALQSQERQLEQTIRKEVQRLLARGRERFRDGALEPAQQDFESALSLDPQNEAARGYLSYLGTVRREAQRTGRAPVRLRAPERFATEAEIRAEGFHQNALAAERSGDPWRAIHYELRALRLHPEHAEARRHLARLRSELAPDVDRLIESGRSYFRREDLQAALDQWRRALLVDPRNERAREYVTRAERMLENLERLRSEPPANVGSR